MDEKIDLPIYDQGDLGCSAACATAVALQYMLAHPPKEVEFLYFRIRPIA
jgi:hypothetical protein